MQIRQLLGPVHYWEIRETGQREIEFLVDWVHFIHCGSSTSLHIRGNPTEKLFHIFVLLEQRVKYSECWLEVLLNHICKKKNKQTNKQISSVVNKKVQTSRSSARANGTQNSGLVKFASESRWPFVHTSRTSYRNCLELVSTMALKKWNTNFRLEWSDFSMTLKNGFGKCLLFVLSANGWKDQNMDSSFSRQRKP